MGTGPIMGVHPEELLTVQVFVVEVLGRLPGVVSGVWLVCTCGSMHIGEGLTSCSGRFAACREHFSSKPSCNHVVHCCVDRGGAPSLEAGESLRLRHVVRI